MNDLEQLIANLEHLMAQSGLDSQGKLHRASGVSQTHIGNILRREKSPSLYIVEQLAAAFGLKSWQLLAPPHIMKTGVSPDVAKLVNHYAQSDQAGRQTILRVAESQSAYKTDDQ